MDVQAAMDDLETTGKTLEESLAAAEAAVHSAHAQSGLRQRRGAPHPQHPPVFEDPHPLADDDLESDDEPPEGVRYVDRADCIDEALFERRRKAALVYPENPSLALKCQSICIMIAFCLFLGNFLWLAFTGRHFWLVSTASHRIYDLYIELTTPGKQKFWLLDALNSYMPTDDIQ